MTDFQWMPFMFWFAACLTLIPAGLATTLINPKSIIFSNMISQVGVFLLIVSLGAIFPAVIYLILVFPLNIMMLYGRNLFPESDKQTATESRLTIIIKTFVCVLLFSLLIFAFYKILPENGSNVANSETSPEGIIPDLSLLLILTGGLIMLTLTAIGYFLRRR
ncbi:MAG TPA: hypothetical protein P5268_04810 [Candidatus Marinimicrobia bacterium]|nr:hypothetical protein [Candidatus Neomarinimicrobiota bacterium]HRS51583.1 hypothetical protein [Candidatus Neomarinimicrobiota bacterium]HRU92339.1 hypothetical protein [Candidatus Neomarinimicrobiota bacterium]